MCDIINTERGKNKTPNERKYITMTLYTVTYEEFNAMTLADINAMIEAIESDSEMWSAKMADRLIGDEKKEYEHNNDTLRRLYQKRAMLTPTSIETLKSNIQFYNNEIETLEKQNKAKEFWKDRNAEMWKRAQFAIDWNNQKIQEYKDKIAECESELATR